MAAAPVHHQPTSTPAAPVHHQPPTTTAVHHQPPVAVTPVQQQTPLNPKSATKQRSKPVCISVVFLTNTQVPETNDDVVVQSAGVAAAQSMPEKIHEADSVESSQETALSQALPLQTHAHTEPAVVSTSPADHVEPLQGTAEAYAKKLADTLIILNAREEMILSLGSRNASLEDTVLELQNQVHIVLLIGPFSSIRLRACSSHLHNRFEVLVRLVFDWTRYKA